MSKKRQAESTEHGLTQVQRPRFQPRTPAPLPTRRETPVLAPAGPPGIRPCPFFELPTSRDRGDCDRGDWARAMGAPLTQAPQAPAAAGTGSAAPAAVFLAASADVPEWITAAAKRLVERRLAAANSKMVHNERKRVRHSQPQSQPHSQPPGRPGGSSQQEEGASL